MALFEESHFGKPISKELSNYLQTYTDRLDRADISTKTDIGTSTIRDVMYRSNALTKTNSEAIIELMRIAVKNCTNRIKGATQVKEKLESMLEWED